MPGFKTGSADAYDELFNEVGIGGGTERHRAAETLEIALDVAE